MVGLSVVAGKVLEKKILVEFDSKEEIKPKKFSVCEKKLVNLTGLVLTSIDPPCIILVSFRCYPRSRCA